MVGLLCGFPVVWPGDPCGLHRNRIDQWVKMAAIHSRRGRSVSKKRTRSCSHPPIIKRNENGPPPLLATGYVLKNRWRVDAQLNKGAFGEVCVAYDTVANRTVAIKSESLNARTPFLGMDVDVLRKLQVSYFCYQNRAGDLTPPRNASYKLL